MTTAFSTHCVDSIDTTDGPIIAFDLDGTLITTKSGKTHPVDNADWKWLTFPLTTKEYLIKLSSEGCNLVIFTNQKGIQKGKTSLDAFKKKLDAIFCNLGFTIPTYIATHDNQYRKPYTLLWWEYFNNSFGWVEATRKIIYVGDAAGREYPVAKYNDFSCTDRMFAYNCSMELVERGFPKMEFCTPDVFFQYLNSTDRIDNSINMETILDNTPFKWGGYDVSKIKLYTDEQVAQEVGKITNGVIPNELILMVGLPASGKSTFAKRAFPNHILISQDIEKTKAKCHKKVITHLGKSPIVVDNTNLILQLRKEYIDMATKAGVKVRCVVMGNPNNPDCLQLCKHLNLFRRIENPDKYVPEIAYRTMLAQLQECSTDEGFVSCHSVPIMLTNLGVLQRLQ